jgi:Protein of unknown function (DUF4239)
VSLPLFILLVGGGALVFGVGGVFLVRRIAARSGYVPQHDDLLGASYSVAGTAFAVLLAFVVFLAWEHHTETRHHLEDEADAVGNLYRLTDGLSPSARPELQSELICYRNSVIDDEFPAMADGDAASETEEALDRMFRVYSRLPISGERESGVYQTVLPLLDTVDDSRHDRLLAAKALIPNFAWVILLIAAAVTIAGTFLFYAERLAIQLAMTLTAVVLVCGSIFLIFYFEEAFNEDHGLEPTAIETALPPGAPVDRTDCPP